MKWALGEDGFPLFDEWSRTAPEKYHYDKTVEQWNSFAIPGDGRRDDRAVTGLGTVYDLAKKHEWPGMKNLPYFQAKINALKTKASFDAVKLPTVQPGCPQGGPVTDGSAPAGMKGDNLPAAMLTARELKDMAFPAQKYICEGLISEDCSTSVHVLKLGRAGLLWT